MLRKSLVALAAALALASCASRLSTHPVASAELGAPVTTNQMLEALQRPGVVTVEQVLMADWRWSEAFATPGVEPPDWRNGELIGQVYLFKLRHPTQGLVLVDAGLPADTVRLLGPIVRNVFKIRDTFVLRQTTAQALGGEAPRAVLLTHLHWDHVLGARDLPRTTPLYIGPGEGEQRHPLLRFIAPITRRALEGRPPLREWRFAPAPAGELSAVDVFGDGSVFALQAPGHTPGSTAYLVNAVDGVHLITGDAIHTREGWLGEKVEYITLIDADRAQAWATLASLQALAARIPGVIVHPGHQRLER